MILQSTMYQKQNIDLSSAPWTMHEFFAGSGLVAYGLRGMFAPVWANDISEQKAAVYEANFGCERFVLDDIKNIKGADLPFAHLSWASFPCQDLSLAGSIGGIHASRSVWCGNGCACWMRWTINRRFSCWRTWRVCFRQTAATIIEFFIWRSWSEGINAELLC